MKDIQKNHNKYYKLGSKLWIEFIEEHDYNFIRKLSPTQKCNLFGLYCYEKAKQELFEDIDNIRNGDKNWYNQIQFMKEKHLGGRY